MDKFKQIKPMAIGLAFRNNKVLAHEGFDVKANKYFYRIIGGGIEFLESSEQALIREFKEEISADIKIVEKLEVVENVFEHQGKRGHEIMFVYRVEIPENQIQEEYSITEGNIILTAKWLDKEDILNGKMTVYPEIIKKYI